MKLIEVIKATAGDGVPSEIEYRDDKGWTVGYWAYGSFDPNLPYQGGEYKPCEDCGGVGYVTYCDNPPLHLPCPSCNRPENNTQKSLH